MIISIRALSVSIATMRGKLTAVRGVDLDVQRGEILGIVGESGCGKSTLVLALSDLLPRNAEMKAESLLIDSLDWKNGATELLTQVRRKKIGYIFQDPQVSLNPVMTIGDQIYESILVNEPKLSKAELTERASALLTEVQIQNPKTWLDSYPHHLSGGMKQRVMIAMALSKSPEILVADEPTTSLDVTVQSEILQLLKELNQQKKTTILFITHDLAVAKKICNRIAVMYAGVIVEIADSVNIFQNPQHPYTYNLWKSIPIIDAEIGELQVIQGNVPNPMHLPKGCKFEPRCQFAQDDCRKTEPKLPITLANAYACYHPIQSLSLEES